ncbi:glycosyltransferase [Helicobacter sp. faydin-H76]|uniref:Glycosyltransferase n=1 Tax=Helicobacter cappadocius TaxID=3063998 RepID=A0AA90PIZ0_9HELI|nr:MULTISPECIES: glycosyltransferase [unclassified Helicobacter]MDO7252588.1 glycosyltransferase [Helicobacter sp. faydin-H75]MDP2538455.1 glycosyltransferase [Helicobacter sp. faydin-H76]
MTQDQQASLQKTIESFSNCSLEFINTKGLFSDIWESLTSKHHFSKEIFYKFIPSRFFPQYDKIIITDVDVVFLGDVSESFLDFDANTSSYLAGIKLNNPDQFYPLIGWKEGYKKFSKIEFEAIQNGIGAGYFIANLKAMRKNNIEQKFIDYATSNIHKLILPEQDVLNIICYPHIHTLSLKHMIANYTWKVCGEKWEKLSPCVYTQKQIDEARLQPIQIHYAGHKKPWFYTDEPKSDLWFFYLAQTPFLQEHLNRLPCTIIALHKKTLLLYRIKSYLQKNPLFLFQASFYLRFYKKIKQILRFNS